MPLVAGGLLLAGMLVYLALRNADQEAVEQVGAANSQAGEVVEGLEVLPADEREQLLDVAASDQELGRTTMAGPDGQPIGYVLEAEVDALLISTRLSFTLPMPMYDVETDAPIGFWFSSVGFVALEEFEEPGFDIEQVVLDRYGPEALEEYRETRARYGE